MALVLKDRGRANALKTRANDLMIFVKTHAAIAIVLAKKVNIEPYEAKYKRIFI
jgi:hypothetical protein